MDFDGSCGVVLVLRVCCEFMPFFTGLYALLVPLLYKAAIFMYFLYFAARSAVSNKEDKTRANPGTRSLLVGQ